MQMWGSVITTSRATMGHFGELQGSKYTECPAYLYVIQVRYTYWRRTIFSHSSLTVYKLSVQLHKLENKPAFLEFAFLVTDDCIQAKKPRFHLPIGVRHAEDQSTASRRTWKLQTHWHLGICPRSSKLFPVRSMPEKLHTEQNVW